jgi:uncharacterized membrane protein
MLHLYLIALAGVIAANGIAVLVAVALATRQQRWSSAEFSRPIAARSQLFLLVGSILPHWRTRPLHSMKNKTGVIDE